MRVLVRLLLLAGVAAATALLLRARIARLAEGEVARAVGAFARSRTVVAKPATAVPRPEESKVQHVTAVPVAAANPSAQVPAVRPARVPASTPAQVGRPVLSRAEIRDVIAAGGAGIRVAPVRNGAGAIEGYALRQVGGLSRYGLAEGDLVLRANGAPVRNADEALAALGAAERAGRADLVLVRGGAQIALSFDLSD
jgi:hypothetical protein